jgi:hypothetical protein
VFVKPPEILSRDRLLGTYEVRPVLAKLRGTLLGAAGLLVAASLALGGLIAAHTDADGVYGRGSTRTPRQVTASGVIYSKRVKDLSQLAGGEAPAEGGGGLVEAAVGGQGPLAAGMRGAPHAGGLQRSVLAVSAHVHPPPLSSP